MELVSIAEFIDLTRLDAASILRMLADGELEFERGELGELLIDIANLSPQDVASSGMASIAPASPEHTELLEETIASEIVFALESMIGEALEIASNWKENPKDKEL